MPAELTNSKRRKTHSAGARNSIPSMLSFRLAEFFSPARPVNSGELAQGWPVEGK